MNVDRLWDKYEYNMDIELDIVVNIMDEDWSMVDIDRMYYENTYVLRIEMDLSVHRNTLLICYYTYGL